jgi:hypothetical protein
MDITIPKLPENCILSGSIIGNDDQIISTLHCQPYLDINTVTVKKIGGMTKVTLRRVTLAKGVNTRDVHEFNTFTGYIKPDDETENARKTESQRVSITRTVNEIRELAANNDWNYFVTITLSSKNWNRYTADGLQYAIKEESRRWRNMQMSKVKPYADYKYLFIPEKHKDGAIHLHGLVKLLPVIQLKAYTLSEVNSSVNLPKYICEKVRKNDEIYHCLEWDEMFGWNTVEPIRDIDRAANYILKYVTKDVENSPFKTRFWHSRGLKRAENICTFIIPQGDAAIDEYTNYVAPIAAVTKNGEILHREYYRPKVDNVTDTLSGINTIIDKDTMTTDDVIEYLSQKYDKFEVEFYERQAKTK